MDWEAVGRELKQRWRTALAVDVSKETLLFGAPLRHAKPEFSKAIEAYIGGDHTKLTAYLWTHRISQEQQVELAAALEEAASRPKTGRPEDLEHMAMKQVAELALSFYRWWKDENARLGVKDWGHRGEMRTQACEFACEFRKLVAQHRDDRLLLLGCDDVEAVRQLTTAPKSRRSST